MNRRQLLGLFAGLPLMGWLKPKAAAIPLNENPVVGLLWPSAVSDEYNFYNQSPAFICNNWTAKKDIWIKAVGERMTADMRAKFGDDVFDQFFSPADSCRPASQLSSDPSPEPSRHADPSTS